MKPGVPRLSNVKEVAALVKIGPVINPFLAHFKTELFGFILGFEAVRRTSKNFGSPCAIEMPLHRYPNIPTSLNVIEMTGGNDKIIKIEKRGHAEDLPLFGLPVLADPRFKLGQILYSLKPTLCSLLGNV